MLHLLSWAARLVKYYKEGVPTGELKVPEIKSEREMQSQAVAANNAFQIGQRLDAVVDSINKKKVTYQTVGDLRFSNNEHKLLKAGLLSEGQSLKVEIVSLKENGTIKKIKPVL
jgi:hypothetical protein